MGFQHVINGDMIKLRQQKTGASLTVPLHPALKAMLATVPRTNLTFIVTERGAPFTARLRQLLQETVPTCRIATLLNSRPPQGRSDAICECRV